MVASDRSSFATPLSYIAKPLSFCRPFNLSISLFIGTSYHVFIWFLFVFRLHSFVLYSLHEFFHYYSFLSTIFCPISLTAFIFILFPLCFVLVLSGGPGGNNLATIVLLPRFSGPSHYKYA